MEMLKEEGEKYWLQRLKTVSDSRLKELIGGGKGEARTIKEGITREELEATAAKRFVAEEERIKNTEYVNNEYARLFWLNALGEKITEPSWEQEQAELKKDYDDTISWNGVPYVYYKHQCWHCGRVFYSKSDRSRYCTYRCANDAFIKRRKERKEEIRSNRICLFCEKTFRSTRTHTKYCCPSHRVLACLNRTRRKKNECDERK